uniref:U3 small nucleolar RNA-associated protein 18 homolog n=1 Tax=Neolamprologus brichardi TaxID=32507 RepID=A0A3Q4HPZ3_NEOBR
SSHRKHVIALRVRGGEKTRTGLYMCNTVCSMLRKGLQAESGKSKMIVVSEDSRDDAEVLVCFRVDMKHRFRRNLMKGEAESAMTKQKLQQRMREQFQKAMGGTPSWAESSDQKRRRRRRDEEDEDEEDEDEEDDLLRRTGNFVASSDSLPSGILRVKKCLHANSARPSEDRLTTVQFHPSAQVVMTAGLDQSLSLFQVDGKTNPKIQSIHLERFPVHKAQFKKSVCVQTKEVVRSMKINGDVSGVAFSPDGSKVFANSEDGEVYVWDMRSSRCVNRFTDDGCVRGTSIASSQNGQYLACGSQSGVVNVYSQEACLNSANPKPLKAVMNLLTSATALTFNPTSEILAIASRAEDEAVRLVHLPSLTVFSNFPVAKRKIVYRASCLDFSPHSGFFSLANNKGHAPLYRLLHYKEF